MPQNNTYKYLSIVFAIIAVVFIILYFTKPSEKVSDTLTDIKVNAQECQSQILAWQSANGTQATTSAEARADLNDILDECKRGFEDSQDKL